jgi:hypothetical protein
MFQLGIFNISQLNSVLENSAGAKNQPIAIDLYGQIADLPPEKQETAAEIILENFSFSDGSYKKTHAGRFDDFDEKIIAYLAKNITPNKKYKIHDLAVSDGRTSLDFFSKLEKIFPSLDFTASDKNMFVDVFPDAKNKSKKIVKDGEGKILQIIFPPFVLNIYSSKRAFAFKIKKVFLYSVNFFLTLIFLIPPFRNFFFKIDENKKQRLALLQNKVMALAKSKNNFHLASRDLFQAASGEFDTVRAMNVLNPSYFNSREVKKIISNIFSSLANGGFLIIGSNKNAGSEVNGDLFVKKNKRLESLLKFGAGAPFREIILLAKSSK